MSENTLTPMVSAPAVSAPTLLVTWQNPESRTYFLMGHVAQTDQGLYEFTYFPGVDQQPGFRSIPGFPDTSATYSSTVLFPLFSSRLMSDRRPDRKEWLDSHGLDEDAPDLTVLGRSLGRRVADRFEFYPEPDIDMTARTVVAEVPLHGLRYHPEGLTALDIGRLHTGDPLHVIPEPLNAHDARALGVHLSDGTKIGFVPRPLLDYLDRGGLLGGAPTALAAHVNPRLYGFHERVILRVAWTL
ncbi:hypothetical protein F7P69_09505 [Cellulosimicrobium funkei]|nr:hypothetical protein [Cellulosimicrobium funkei]